MAVSDRPGPTAMADEMPANKRSTAPTRSAAADTARTRLMRRLLRNRGVVIGGGVFLLLVLVALLADVLSPYNPTRLYPGQRLQPPSMRNLLGTDEFGRDIASLVLHGSRVSLLVGGVTMLLTSVGGVVIGLIAGYYRRLDVPIMRVMDGLMAFPAILLAIALMAARGPGVWNVIVSLSVVYLPRTAMLIRSTTLSVRELDYVMAAQALGRGGLAIAFRHILPNCMGPLLVQGTFIFAYAVLAEAILGFLGVGVPPYVPSWGNVIASGKNVIREAFWVSAFPGLALTLAGLSLNLLGDGLRDTLDPRLRME
ncbi:MAG TPA: ABC transporter permease [Gemmatimonadales bacterium]|nr:ABC transporter permease [Gemmatimonadales bacterium]